MIKKSILILFVVILSNLSCTSDERLSFTDLAQIVFLNTKEEIEDFTADGKSSLRLRIIYQNGTNLSSVDTKVKLTNASFENNENKELTITPEILQNGMIASDFTIVSTTNPDTVVVDIDLNNFFAKTRLKPKISEPSTIKLSKSSTSTLNDFRGEVTFTGKLSNSKGGKVSQGFMVRFTDFLQDGTKADGEFRAASLSSNSESETSIIYSPGLIQAGQFVEIRVEVLDVNGNPIGITDSTEIFVRAE